MRVELAGVVVEDRENGAVALVGLDADDEVLDSGIARTPVPQRVLHVLLGKVGAHVRVAVVDDAHGPLGAAQFLVELQLLAGVNQVAFGGRAGVAFGIKRVEFHQRVGERVAGVHHPGGCLGAAQHPAGFVGVVRQPLGKALIEQFFRNLEGFLIWHISNQ